MLAAMCLALSMAVAVGLGARGLERLGAAQEQALARERIARLIAPESQSAAEEARAALAADPDVAEARLISPSEAAALVSGWSSDEAVPPEAFAQLRLIAVRLEPTARPDAPNRLQADLAEQGLSIEIANPGPAARSAARSTGAQRLGLAAALAAFAAFALVGFTARAEASRRAPLARMLVDLGATRSQAQRLIGGPIATLGLQAGLIGVVLCAAALAGLVAAVPEMAAMAPSAEAPLAVADLAPLAAAPLIGWIAAGSGARAAIGRAYDRADFAR
jgi:cell division protein FtsX